MLTLMAFPLFVVAVILLYGTKLVWQKLSRQ